MTVPGGMTRFAGTGAGVVRLVGARSGEGGRSAGDAGGCCSSGNLSREVTGREIRPVLLALWLHCGLRCALPLAFGTFCADAGGGDN
jgi:hypothetical protein